MNYIKQLNELYFTLDYKPLTVEAIAVYFVLLQIANKTGWIDEFRVANTVLMSKCNISIDTLKTARNKLKTLGYIDYTKGKNQNDAPKYRIIKLYTSQPLLQAEPQAEPQALLQAEPQAEPQALPQAEPQPLPHINKQNETKQKRNSKRKTFTPPTLQEVENYIQEKNLKVDANYFYNYFTEGNWIDSNGNSVKNWKQKLITWNNRNIQQVRSYSNSKNKIDFNKIIKRMEIEEDEKK